MPDTPLSLFGPFRLDPVNECVWRGEETLRLTPKAFALLRYLVEHPDRLVTKEELLKVLWPRIYVSDGALWMCIGEIRKVLGDRPQTPQFIETIHRRGYRFIAPVTFAQPVIGKQLLVRSEEKAGATRPQLATDNGQLTSARVGREAELRQLHEWLEKALRGERSLVFITGEPGIGKTTVVETFLERAAESRVLIAHGQCVEHYGTGEPYMPVLEVGGQLCRGPEGDLVISVLRRSAPTWLLQMPALLADAELKAVQRRVQGATRERLLREMVEAVEALAAERPLVLVLEDLHWSDVSTLDLLALLARRREPARLLVIGTYRPVEVLSPEHPLRTVTQELHLHRYCTELRLGFLTEAEVAEYLFSRFPTHRFPAMVARVIHQRTEGNPLFMVNVVDFLLAQGVFFQDGEQWTVREEGKEVAVGVPDNIRQMIERQIERLSLEEQRVLEVASVAGGEFSTAVVAAGAEADVWKVEEWCTGLVRRDRFLRIQGVSEWPDGTTTAHYRFVHALYQDVLYERVPVAQRIRYHWRIGEREEQGYGERAGDIAAELARHFEQGRNVRRAVHYLQQAAENSIQRYAYREAIGHATKGLELLSLLPDTSERLQQELALQTILGMSLVPTQGYTSPTVGAVYERARTLCQQLGDPRQLCSVLVGLWQFSAARAEHEVTYRIGEHMLAVARQEQDPALLLQARSGLGTASFFLGELTRAQEHLEERPVLADPRQHDSPLIMTWLDPGMIGRWGAPLVLWHLGYPDQALEKIHVALTTATNLSHLSRAVVLLSAAFLHQLRGESQRAQERTQTLIALCAEQGFPYFLALSAVLHGWVLASQGQEEAGIAQMRQGLATYQASGAEVLRPYWLALLAEAYGHRGQAAEGLNIVDEALAVVNKCGERFYEAELWRLKGELTLQQLSVVSCPPPGQEKQKANGKGQTLTSRKARKSENLQSACPLNRAAIPNPQLEAEECFHKAIEIARHQSAKSLELRAVMSLARLWQQQDKKKHARRMLAEIYGWFTEGFETADLKEARALLDALT